MLLLSHFCITTQLQGKVEIMLEIIIIIIASFVTTIIKSPLRQQSISIIHLLPMGVSLVKWKVI